MRERVERWIADDPDPETRAALAGLCARAFGAAEDPSDRDAARDALRERFDHPLAFGTAGLRGPVGAGPGRMNRAVAMRTTAGLCAYLEAEVPDAAARGIIVGHDARPTSRRLAEDVAEVAAGAGMRVLAFEEPTPTPLVAFALRALDAAAAVVVTASHNPPQDNGYKVFWSHGGQIVPPHDAGITAAIARTGGARSIPRCPLADAARDGRYERVPAEIVDRYVRGVAGLRRAPRATPPAPLRIAYTALHGVGASVTRRAFAASGLPPLLEVAAQVDPDGTFPTVRSPNPESPEALTELVALAEATRADLALAHDPDADRLGVLVRAGGGALRRLSGDEIGCLLGSYLLEGAAEDAHAGGQPVVLSTVVSATKLGAIAAARGARWEQTLTGHKWIHARAVELEASGYRMVFGYEEALGYAVWPAVRDKDGISAAVVFADMATALAARGQTVWDALVALWRAHGMSLSAQVSVPFDRPGGAAAMRALVARCVDAPPRSLAGHALVRVDDLARAVTHPVTPGGTLGPGEPLPWRPAPLAVLHLEGGHRAMLRPSGTEPKLKLYFEVAEHLDDAEPVAAAEARAKGRIDALEQALMDALDIDG
ncbi:MAG: phospho-sugar mutase [Myxococcales bacterium]|nr:phospho-sugar mutase [Myxococcales bacterium]